MTGAGLYCLLAVVVAVVVAAAVCSSGCHVGDNSALQSVLTSNASLSLTSLRFCVAQIPSRIDF